MHKHGTCAVLTSPFRRSHVGSMFDNCLCCAYIATVHESACRSNNAALMRHAIGLMARDQIRGQRLQRIRQAFLDDPLCQGPGPHRPRLGEHDAGRQHGQLVRCFGRESGAAGEGNTLSADFCGAAAARISNIFNDARDSQLSITVRTLSRISSSTSTPPGWTTSAVLVVRLRKEQAEGHSLPVFEGANVQLRNDGRGLD